jgi:hypothetical protein
MSSIHLNAINRPHIRIPSVSGTTLAGVALLLVFAIAIYAASQSPGTTPDAIASMVACP